MGAKWDVFGNGVSCGICLRGLAFRLTVLIYPGYTISSLEQSSGLEVGGGLVIAWWEYIEAHDRVWCV
jgi:hypothetical protein